MGPFCETPCTGEDAPALLTSKKSSARNNIQKPRRYNRETPKKVRISISVAAACSQLCWHCDWKTNFGKGLFINTERMHVGLDLSAFNIRYHSLSLCRLFIRYTASRCFFLSSPFNERNDSSNRKTNNT